MAKQELIPEKKKNLTYSFLPSALVLKALLKESNMRVTGKKDRRKIFQKPIRVKKSKHEVRAFPSVFNFLYVWNIILSGH